MLSKIPQMLSPQARLAMVRSGLLALVAVVLYGSIIPVRIDVIQMTFSGVVVHFCAYALLGAFGRLSWPAPRGGLLAGLLLALFGSGIEVIQLHVPGRHGCWQDACVDAAGVALGLWISGMLAPWLGLKPGGFRRERGRQG